MRIRSSNNILTITLKHEQSTNLVDVAAYDKNFQTLTCQRTPMGDHEKVSIKISLPNKLMIVFGSNQSSTNHKFELTGMALAGINFNLETITKIIESKFVNEGDMIEKPHDFSKYASSNSKIFTGHSCMILNLFHHNPIAYHLFVGNRIKF